MGDPNKMEKALVWGTVEGEGVNSLLGEVTYGLRCVCDSVKKAMEDLGVIKKRFENGECSEGDRLKAEIDVRAQLTLLAELYNCGWLVDEVKDDYFSVSNRCLTGSEKVDVGKFSRKFDKFVRELLGKMFDGGYCKPGTLCIFVDVCESISAFLESEDLRASNIYEAWERYEALSLMIQEDVLELWKEEFEEYSKGFELLCRHFG